MRKISINNGNRVPLLGDYSSGIHKKNIQDKRLYKESRPAKATVPSGSERLHKKDEISFTGDPKHIQNIATEIMKGDTKRISGLAQKMGGSDAFKKVLKSVDKNEAFFEAMVSLVVAGILKPICVLAMPGAEKEDKEMAATKNAVSAGIGFILSNLILGPVSSGVNKIIKSFDSTEPTKYIKDLNYVNSLKKLSLVGKDKSSLGEAYKSTLKKFPDLGVTPLKASITIALTPIVLKAIFGKDKKAKKQKSQNPMTQMPVMTLIKADSNNKEKTGKTEPAFKGNLSFTGNSISSNSPSFGNGIGVAKEVVENKSTIKAAINFIKKYNPISLIGKAKDVYTNALSEPIAKVLGKASTTKIMQKTVSAAAKFEKPTARWSDLASFAITLFYIDRTRKSEKIDEDRKAPLMINNLMVTIASTLAALGIDRVTDKPMDNLLRSYLTKHEEELYGASAKHITKTINNLLETLEKNRGEFKDAEEILKSARGLIQEVISELPKEEKEIIRKRAVQELRSQRIEKLARKDGVELTREAIKEYRKKAGEELITRKIQELTKEYRENAVQELLSKKVKQTTQQGVILSKRSAAIELINEKILELMQRDGIKLTKEEIANKRLRTQAAEKLAETLSDDGIMKLAAGKSLKEKAEEIIRSYRRKAVQELREQKVQELMQRDGINLTTAGLRKRAAQELMRQKTQELLEQRAEEIIKSGKKGKEAQTLIGTIANIKNNIAHLLGNGEEIIEDGVNTGRGYIKSAIDALQGDDIIKKAKQLGLLTEKQIKELAASGFEQQASKIYKNILKTKSLTVFTITVRFLVTVLMTPVIGKVVAHYKKHNEAVKENKKQQNMPTYDVKNVGMNDYLKSLKK